MDNVTRLLQVPSFTYPAPVSLAPRAPQAIALSTSKLTLGWLHSYSLCILEWLLDIKLPSCLSFSSSTIAFFSLICWNSSTLAASKIYMELYDHSIYWYLIKVLIMNTLDDNIKDNRNKVMKNWIEHFEYRYRTLNC